MDSTLGEKLARMSASRRELIGSLGERERENLALQKETLAAALEIAGVGTEGDSPRMDARHGRTHLVPGRTSGCKGARGRDASCRSVRSAGLRCPARSAAHRRPYLPVRDGPVCSRDRRHGKSSGAGGDNGADLIYFNETYRCFAWCNTRRSKRAHKNMNSAGHRAISSSGELERMDKLLEQLERIEPDTDPDGFRLTSNPFFLKFCSRIVFNPDDRGLFPGIYLPLGLWKALATSDRLSGVRAAATSSPIAMSGAG